MKKLSIALAAVLAMAGAQAATTSLQSFTSGTQTTDFTSTFTFNMFNASLGTLTGVTALWSYQENASGSLHNTSASTQTFRYNATGEFDLTGSLFTGETGFGTLYNNVQFTLAAGATGNLTPASFSGASAAVAINNVASFVGAGTSAVNCATLNGSGFTGGGGNITAAQSTTGVCNFSIQYTYTPTVVTVPEPSSLALVGLALAGLGLIARGRKA